ncbi:MAG: hypothetical protein WCC27_03075 [Acidobacteriaceae bacterium]
MRGLISASLLLAVLAVAPSHTGVREGQSRVAMAGQPANAVIAPHPLLAAKPARASGSHAEAAKRAAMSRTVAGAAGF